MGSYKWGYKSPNIGYKHKSRLHCPKEKTPKNRDSPRCYALEFRGIGAWGLGFRFFCFKGLGLRQISFFGASSFGIWGSVVRVSGLGIWGSGL